jgi:Nucleotidyltransferase
VLDAQRSSRSLASAPLDEQSACLEAILKENEITQAVLSVACELDLRDWYFGAGGVAQTVWNVLHGFEPAVGIKDYDLVYFDAADLTIETEREAEAEVDDRLGDLGIVVDVRTRRESISGTSSVLGAISSPTARPARPSLRGDNRIKCRRSL